MPEPTDPNNTEILIVASKVKEVLAQAGLRVDAELVRAVSDKVHGMLSTAIVRAKMNDRATVRPCDL